jgi:hypothetical protein
VVVEFAAAAEKVAKVAPVVGDGGVGRGVATAEEAAEVAAAAGKTGERAAAVRSRKSMKMEKERVMKWRYHMGRLIHQR